MFMAAAFQARTGYGRDAAPIKKLSDAYLGRRSGPVKPSQNEPPVNIVADDREVFIRREMKLP